VGSKKRIDLLDKAPWLKKLVKMRSFQFILILPNLVLFFLFLIAGVIGNPMGSQNIIIVFVWILWWVVLIGILVPFGSRLWCTMCPLPIIGEWFQRGAIAGVRKGKPFGLNKKWPSALKNIWPQNIGFLCLAIFSALLVTRPIVSVFVLGGMILVAIVLHLIYEKRSFCMYICPVGGFLGLYSMCSTLELRVKDPEVCRQHKEKDCIRGNENGYGCPWFQYPGNQTRNNYCGLCTECIKTCPLDNIAVNVRPFASDDKIKNYDEAWKAFIMITLAMVYSVTLLGPNAEIKDWANATFTGEWRGFLTYALVVLSSALAGFPAVYAVFAWLAKVFSGNKEVSFENVFIRYSFVLVPMGLLAWIAFSVPLVMINGAYIVSVISDPMGWGWDLFGTKEIHWHPVLPGWVPYIQAVLLMVGLWFSIKKGHDVGRQLFKTKGEVIRSLIPITVLLIGVVIAFLTQYVN
jgi:ferredoxin